MARYWSCGFEQQSKTVEFDGLISSSNCSISTTIKRSGNAAFRVNASNSDGGGYHVIKDMVSGDTFYFRAYINIHDGVASDSTIFAAFDNGAGKYTWGIKLASDNKLKLMHTITDGATQVGSSSSALSLDTWYRVEFSGVYDTDTMTARLNGVEFASGTATSVVFGDEIDWGISLSSYDNNETADIYFDDIAFNTSTGSYQNSFPGAGAIVHMYPDSAGDSAAPSGTYADLDEVPVSDSDYITLTTNGDVGDYNMQSSLSVGIDVGDTINVVAVGARIAGVTAVQCQYRTRIKSQAAGTVSESGTISNTSTNFYNNKSVQPRVYQLHTYVEPEAGGSWTASLLDTSQIGVRALDADPDIKISSLWALVDYVATSASASTSPSNSPISSPSSSPSNSPSTSPSNSPSVSPSSSPSHSASTSPSNSPSVSPSSSPSNSPSTSPSNSPSASPSASPSNSPSASPSNSPSHSPSYSPSNSPSTSPSSSPSSSPSHSPSNSPSTSPSSSPSTSPSSSPSHSASTSPSSSPSGLPSDSPSTSPSNSPSTSPSSSPSSSPSASTSNSPSASPSNSPTSSPSASPSNSPSSSPSASPSPSPGEYIDIVPRIKMSSKIKPVIRTKKNAKILIKNNRASKPKIKSKLKVMSKLKVQQIKPRNK